MALTSYGTITISDVTDISDVYLEYCLALESRDEEDLMDGSQAIPPFPSQTGGNAEVDWSETPPAWIPGYQIWKREVKVYSEGGSSRFEYLRPYLDTAVNKLNDDLSTLNSKLKYMWRNATPRAASGEVPAYPAGTYAASAIIDAETGTVLDPFDSSNSNTYGFNSFLDNIALKFRYNAIDITTIGTSGIKLFSPIIGQKTYTVDETEYTVAAITGANKGLEIDSNGIRLYKNNGVSDKLIAQFGEQIILGEFEENKYNMQIAAEGINLRYYNKILNKITSNGMELFLPDDQNLSIAKFSSIVRIGKMDKTRVEITSNSLELTSGNTTFFRVRDAVNESGQVTDTFVGTGENLTCTLSYEASNTNYTITINSSEITPASKTTSGFTLSSSQNSFGDIIVATYNVTGNSAKAFDFGYRANNTISGSYSVIEGFMNTASGYASHAENYYTSAIGNGSHAEGYRTSASGIYSHAEGMTCEALGIASHAEGDFSKAMGVASHAEGSSTATGGYSHAEIFGQAIGHYSHAEGTSIAQGECSHAEGQYTTSQGKFSHSQNFETYAVGYAQTAIGMYNIKNGSPSSKNDTDYSFIIGNGTSSARSNAYAITWDGETEIALNINAQTGTDYDLYAAIHSLNWDSDVLTT